MITSHQKNISTFIHLSTFLGFFIPFGNFIGPLVLWYTNKEKSEFVDAHGKQAINFQISVFLYGIVLCSLIIPMVIFGIWDHINVFDWNTYESVNISLYKPSPLLFAAGGLSILGIFGFILEILFIIIASLKARDGELYKYPLTINFLK